MKGITIMMFFLPAIVFLTVSCDRSLIVPDVSDFDVSTEKTVYHVGEEVNFVFSGSPEIITFYSGEKGNDYAFRDGRVVNVNATQLSFSSAYVTAAGAQPRQYSVWVSSDFNGNYTDFSHVSAATWTEVTDRFTFSANATFVPAGDVNLSDLIEPGKPLYIGFRYVTLPQRENGVVRSWLVQAFALRAVSADESILLSDLAGAGFRFVEQNPETAPSRSALTATRITLLGNLFTEGHDPATETWAISRAFDTGDIDLGPDRPLKVKGKSDAKQESFQHTYMEAGSYKVYFVATNATIDEQKSVIRELEIQVLPQ